MKKLVHQIYLVIICCLVNASITKAQLTVQGGFTPTQLVQNLLGNGVTVSNITYTGNPAASGTFDGTNANLGITSGILLTTGDIINAPGPNNTSAATTGWQLPGDSLLDSIIQSITNDACVLEFDFMPMTTVVTFRFVFGSEEYNEYVNTGFNDVFGFFVSGPGITGVQNISLVPLTTIPVSINNVNNGQAFGQSTGPCMNCAYFFDNFNGTSVQYDAFTVPITAQMTVTPCETYHMKIAIADVSDGSFDSGVFLEAGSFSGGTPITVASTVSNPVITEGCDSSIITFTFDSILPNADTIFLMPFGTASNTLDFSTLPFYIIANPGDTQISITVNSISDQISEGTETLLLYFVYYSNCGVVFDSVLVDILDVPPITTTATADTSVCLGTTLILNASSTGGNGLLTYLWSNGSTDQSITVIPLQTTTYTIIVNDECSRADTTLITVTVSNIAPVVTVTNDTTICPGTSVTLFANATGGNSITYLWDNAVTGQTYTVTPAQTTTYNVVVTNDCNQTTAAQVTVTVINQPPIVNATADTTICPGAPIILSATASSGTSPYTYLWDNTSTGSSYNVAPIVQTTYTVIATDKCNYTDTTQVTVAMLPEPILSLTSNNDLCQGKVFNINYTGDNFSGSVYNWNFDNGTILSGTGTGPYEIIWDVVAVHTVTFNLSYMGCYNKTDTLLLNEILCDLIIPNVITPNGDQFNETFFIEGLDKFPNSSILIYNRWGKVLLENSNYQNDWNAEGSPDGVYYYVLNVPGLEPYKGTITVLRAKQ